MRRFLCVFVLAVAAGPVVAAAPAKKPNVLFIAVDDLNDWVGVLGGHPGVKTPNIDRLSKSGCLFTKAYCSAPLCNPSRAALLTGRLASTTGVYLNTQPWRPASDAVTLPRYFRDHGYLTHGGGKVFHANWNDDTAWDHYQKLGASPTPKNAPVNGIAKAGHFDWGAVDCRDEEMADFKTAEMAATFLKEPHDKPFFLAAGFYRPHLPFYAPKKYFDLYPLESIQLPDVLDTDLDDVPSAGVTMAKPAGDHAKVVAAGQWKLAVQAYLACVTFTDTMIGKVLDAVDASGHADDTIVVFWSDHGWHLGEKQHWRKFALWEEACRVNFVVAAPGVTRPGETCGRPVALIDIYPTLVDLCGLPPKDGLDGPVPAAAAGRPERGLGPPGPDHLRPEQPRPPVREVSVHPLRRRVGGVVRPRCRPERMEEPGHRPGLRRGESRARQVPPEGERPRCQEGPGRGRLTRETGPASPVRRPFSGIPNGSAWQANREAV